MAREVLGVGKALPLEVAPPQRMHQAAGDHAADRGNAPGQQLVAVAEEQQPVQRMRDRGDETEGFDAAAVGGRIHMLQRLGVFGDFAHMAAQPPGRGHAKAYGQSAQQHAGVAPRPERERDQQAAQPQAQRQARGRQRPVRGARQQFGQQGQRVELQLHAVEPAHARHGGDALERGKGRQAHDQQHHQRLEAAAAQAREIARAAARGQHHAGAKQQAADQGRQPRQLPACIEGVAHGHAAPQHQRGRAAHRHAHGHGPLAHARPVLQIDHVAERAHGAKARFAHGKAEPGGQQKNDRQDGGRQGGKLGSTHARIGRCIAGSAYWHIPAAGR